MAVVFKIFLPSFGDVLVGVFLQKLNGSVPDLLEKLRPPPYLRQDYFEDFPVITVTGNWEQKSNWMKRKLHHLGIALQGHRKYAVSSKVKASSPAKHK